MWNSRNEMLPDADVSAYLLNLEKTDLALGELARAKYGQELYEYESVALRQLNRFKFYSKKYLGTLLQKVLRRLAREWYRNIIDRYRVKDGKKIHLESSLFHVLALTRIDLTSSVNESEADFIILTREPNQLLKCSVLSMKRALQNSSADMWFGDSRNQAGIRNLRSVFTPLLHRQLDALGPIIIIRRKVLNDLLEFLPKSPYLWPLQLGLLLSPGVIELIPEVLGVSGQFAYEPSRQDEQCSVNLVINEVAEKGYGADVEKRSHGRRRVLYRRDKNPLISIIIPTRGTFREGRYLIVDAVQSIIEKSTFRNFELVIVADDVTPQEVVSQIDRIASNKVVWVRWKMPFHFSKKVNLGAACANGDLFIFLNDDVEIVTADWIERMYSLLGIDNIGYVGALLFFSNQQIQHAGQYFAGGAGHIGFMRNFHLENPNDIYSLDRIVSGVTGACSCISRSTFESVGGFSNVFPGNYNDVDLSLKVREYGKQIAVAAGARLYHLESMTRDPQVLAKELRALHSRWHNAIQADSNFRQ